MSLCQKALAATLIFVVGCSFRAPTIATYGPPPDRRVIQNVNVVDVEAGKVIQNQDVWIRRGRIEAIVPTGEIEPESVSQVFPAKGRYILPGFIDGHVHVQGGVNPPWDIGLPDIRANLQRLLYGGITTAMDMGGNLSKLEQARGFVEDGRYQGPDLFYSGPGITVYDGHPSQLSTFFKWPFKKIARKHLAVEVENREDVNVALSNVKRYNGTIAKFMLDEIPVGAPKLSEQLLKFAATRAHAMGLIVAVHVGTNEEALMAIEAGADILAHNVYRERIEEKTLSWMKSQNVKVIPTVGVFERINDIQEQRPVTWTALTKDLTPQELLDSLYDVPGEDDFVMPEGYEKYLSSLEAQRETRIWNTWALRDAGIPIVVGSDSPNVGWQAGSGLHEELKLLVKAGYTAEEVIKAVTFDNATYFDFRDRGKLEVEYRADLILFTENPLEDIDALDTLESVFVEGSLVARRAIKE